MRRVRALLALLPRVLAPCVLAGCWLPPSWGVPYAVERFGKDLACPVERVAVRARADLRVHHFACMKEAPRFAQRRASGVVLRCGEPPLEIEADPARVALWREQRARDFRPVDEWDGPKGVGPLAIVELTGCGARRFYACEQLCHELGDADPLDLR